MSNRLKRWIVDILAAFYDRCIRPEVKLCGHGYIEVTCAQCSENWRTQ